MRTNRQTEKRAALLERLVADLRDPRHAKSDPNGHERLCAAFAFLLEGAGAELTLDGLNSLRRLVPGERLPRCALL